MLQSILLNAIVLTAKLETLLPPFSFSSIDFSDAGTYGSYSDSV